MKLKSAVLAVIAINRLKNLVVAKNSAKLHQVDTLCFNGIEAEDSTARGNPVLDLNALRPASGDAFDS